MDFDWNKLDADALAKFEKDCRDQMKRSAADRDFAQAALNAKYSNHDLRPMRGEFGELKFSRQQVAEAACYAREDVSAVLQIQLPILKRLDTLKWLGWACFFLLLYIAYRLS